MEYYFFLTDRNATYIALERSTGPPDTNMSQSGEYRNKIERLAAKHSGTVVHDCGRKSHTRANPSERRHFYGGGFIEYWDNVQAAFTTTAATVAFLGAAKAFLLQWLKNKASRSATFKMGDWEISVKGTDDISQILKKLTSFYPDSFSASKIQAPKTKRKKGSAKPKKA
jgi:hypothetical protein